MLLNCHIRLLDHKKQCTTCTVKPVYSDHPIIMPPSLLRPYTYPSPNEAIRFTFNLSKKVTSHFPHRDCGCIRQVLLYMFMATKKVMNVREKLVFRNSMKLSDCTEHFDLPTILSVKVFTLLAIVVLDFSHTHVFVRPKDIP